jgi:hypothetical protein
MGRPEPERGVERREGVTDGGGWADATIPLVWANVIAFAMIPFVALVVLGPYALLWGPAETWESLDTAFRPLWLFLVIFFGAILVHEGLHGVGFALFGRVPRREIHFGVKWLTFTPYTHTQATMPANAYRAAVALPALALGVVPAVLGVLLQSGILAGWGALMLGTAGGDLAVLWAIRSVPADKLVRDHPTKAGCQVRVA